jgi:hypothetical protein
MATKRIYRMPLIVNEKPIIAKDSQSFVKVLSLNIQHRLPYWLPRRASVVEGVVG